MDFLGLQALPVGGSNLVYDGGFFGLKANLGTFLGISPYSALNEAFLEA